MRIYRTITIDVETGTILHSDSYDYDGPLALCDRAAQQQASQAAGTAKNVAGTYESEAQATEAQLTPWLTQRLNAEHVMSPDQINELLSYAGAGAGGATGAVEGSEELEAARTRNTGNLNASLDAAARARTQALAKASEGIGAEDVEGALREREGAAQGLGQLFGVESGAALKAMGIQTGDINAEIAAGQTGWFQNMNSMISTLTGAAKTGGQIATGSYGNA